MTKFRGKITIFIIMMLTILGVNTVNASTSDFTIESVSVKEKVGAIEVVDPVSSSNKITSAIKFNEKDDEVTLEIKIKNTAKSGYRIESITDNNTNDHIAITYDYDNQEYFYTNEFKTITVNIKYVDEIINVETTDLSDLKISLKFINEEEIKGEDIIIVNPTTGDNIYLFVALMTLSIIAIIVVIVLIKDSKHKMIIAGVSLFAMIIMMIPFIFNITKSYEENSYTIEFTNITVMGKLDEYNVVILDEDDNELETRIIKYGYTVGDITFPSKTGYEITKWVDADSNELTKDTQVYSDLTVKAVYELIDYTITYNLNGGYADNPDTYTYETATFTLNNPTRTDYEFLGWYGSNGSTPQTTVKITKHSKGNKTYNAKWKPVGAVAEINGDYYVTLAETMTKVKENVPATINIVANVTERLDIPENKNVTLNLNGYTIKNSCYDTGQECNTVRNYGTLTVINGTVLNDTDAGAINNYPGANLIVDGATITAQGKRQAIYNEGTLTVKGNATLTSTTSQRATLQNQPGAIMYVEDATVISEALNGIENKSVLVIGKKDGVINSSPYIRGKTYGVKSTTTFDFYDGLLSGKTNSMDCTVGTFTKINDYEEHTVLTQGTELIGSATYKTTYMRYLRTITLDPTGGTLADTEISVAEGEQIGTLPKPTHDTLYFIGWYDDPVGGVQINDNYVPTSNMTIYARWTDTDPFPAVFEQTGACTFNGQGNDISGTECTNYVGQDYINTGISLFSTENIGLDFELSFDVDSIDSASHVSSAKETLVANKNEIGGGHYAYGFALRHDDKYNLYYTNDGASAVKHTIGTTLTSVKIVRKDNKIYYSFDNEDLTYMADADLDHPFTSPVVFGAALDENQQPFRYLKGTFSNIKIRLGKIY